MFRIRIDREYPSEYCHFMNSGKRAPSIMYAKVIAIQNWGGSQQRRQIPSDNFRPIHVRANDDCQPNGLMAFAGLYAGKPRLSNSIAFCSRIGFST